MGSPGTAIFVNYRHSDSDEICERLCERLREEYGRSRILTSPDVPVESVELAWRALAGCFALLAVIGPGWLDAGRASQRSRLLYDPQDPVRVEIETALQAGLMVIPVLTEGATMPRAADLPSKLAPLADQQPFRLDHGKLEAGIERIIGLLDWQSPRSVESSASPGAVPVSDDTQMIDLGASGAAASMRTEPGPGTGRSGQEAPTTNVPHAGAPAGAPQGPPAGGPEPPPYTARPADTQPQSAVSSGWPQAPAASQYPQAAAPTGMETQQQWAVPRGPSQPPGGPRGPGYGPPGTPPQYAAGPGKRPRRKGLLIGLGIAGGLVVVAGIVAAILALSSSPAPAHYSSSAGTRHGSSASRHTGHSKARRQSPFARLVDLLPAQFQSSCHSKTASVNAAQGEAAIARCRIDGIKVTYTAYLSQEDLSSGLNLLADGHTQSGNCVPNGSDLNILNVTEPFSFGGHSGTQFCNYGNTLSNSTIGWEDQKLPLVLGVISVPGTVGYGQLYSEWKTVLFAE